MRPQPVTWVIPCGDIVTAFSHRGDIRVGSNFFRVVCRGIGGEGCDFGGKYPTREHARAVLDLHLIRTHVTGKQTVLGHGHDRRCDGCAAVRRRERLYAVREQTIVISSFGLSDEEQEALFDRVADAAHALDEQVTCQGSLRAFNQRIGGD